MAEYIERTWIVGKLTSSGVQAAIRGMDGSETYSFFLALLNAAPVANVVERKRGEWFDVFHWDWKYQCSCCRNGADLQTDFCPNCGADMRRADQ